jgi:hypothetical protein
VAHIARALFYDTLERAWRRASPTTFTLDQRADLFLPATTR